MLVAMQISKRTESLRSRVSHTDSNATSVSSWSQCCTNSVVWDLGTRHRLHGLYVLSPEYKQAAKLTKQAVRHTSSRISHDNLFSVHLF